MAKTSAVNATAQGAWQYGNAAGDQFAKEDLELLGANFDLHTHASTKGLPVVLSTASNVLSGDVSLSNTGTFFDGPSMAQGTTGTWWVVGTVVFYDTAVATTFNIKLWDGTTVIATASARTSAASTPLVVTLGGILASPAGNIRISVQDAGATTGKILFNASGLSKDASIWGIRIA